MNWKPTFFCFLITIFVFTWLMKDRNTNFTVFMNIGMPKLRHKCHFWWSLWVFFREDQMRFEIASLVECFWGSYYHQFPFEKIVIINKARRKAFKRFLLQFLKLSLKKKSSLCFCTHLYRNLNKKSR